MIIEAKNLHKSFGSLKVLKGVDFAAGKGEVVAITGASGAGKTTLLEILGTLSSPDSGSLVIDGTNVSALGGNALSSFRGKRIGFVFQFHHLLPEFTSEENVMIPALIAGKGRLEARETALSLLKRVGLGDRLNHKPSELSGGEQQRVAIARALVNSPAVLFADEPTGNLDSRTKEEIHSLFFELRDSLGQTIVIVTHDQALAALCDRSLLMKDGQFVSAISGAAGAAAEDARREVTAEGTAAGTGAKAGTTAAETAAGTDAKAGATTGAMGPDAAGADAKAGATAAETAAGTDASAPSEDL